MARTIDAILKRAWEALESEEYDEAESLGRRALLADPRSVEARLLIGNALLSKEDYESAVGLLGEAVNLAPDDPEPRTDLGIALFQMCDFPAAERHFQRALELRDDAADARYWMALCRERDGDTRGADRHFRLAHEIDPEEFPLPIRMSHEDFQKALQEAIDQLPEEFHTALENVLIEVEDLPDDELLRDYDPPMDPTLLGLFEGVPRAGKSLLDSPRLPDRIVLFQRNIERRCSERDELVEEIVVTLRHEIGHYLGMEEEDLERCGYD